jgi:flavoprotein
MFTGAHCKPNIKHYAAPVDAIRRGVETPCAANGLCRNCRAVERVCNMWSVVEGHRIRNRIHVKLVGEVLGY